MQLRKPVEGSVDRMRPSTGSDLEMHKGESDGIPVLDNCVIVVFKS